MKWGNRFGAQPAVPPRVNSDHLTQQNEARAHTETVHTFHNRHKVGTSKCPINKEINIQWNINYSATKRNETLIHAVIPVIPETLCYSFQARQKRSDIVDSTCKNVQNRHPHRDRQRVVLPGAQAKEETTANGQGLFKGMKMFCTASLATQLCECAKSQ